MTTVAVLAIQGAFREHEARLASLGASVFEIRKERDLDRPFSGLVLPGGESTVQSKLLRDLGLFEILKSRIQEGLPVLGTCAGLILLAASIAKADGGQDEGARRSSRHDSVIGFATLPVTVERNGYGRQSGSFHAMAPLEPEYACSLPDSQAPHVQELPLTFIRAPRIASMAPGVKPIVTLNGEPVAVEYENQIGLAFHPELDDDDFFFELFLRKARAYEDAISSSAAF